MMPPQQPQVPQVPYQPPFPPKKNKPSLTIKLLVIALLILLLAVPWGLLQWLIYDREHMSEEAIEEVSQKWSNPQNVRGPVLYIPFYNVSTGQASHFKVLPEELNITGNVVPEKRYRGIYEVIVYSVKLSVTGKMRIPDSTQLRVGRERVQWDNMLVGIGITDMRGIRESISLKWGDSVYTCNPGIEISDDGYAGASGVSSLVRHTDKETLPGAVIPFSFELSLNGSKNLTFEPLGKVTNLHLASTWADPKFSGEFLPDNRKIDEKGFSADWKVLHLNRNFPQVWTDNSYSTHNSRFGVELVVPVDHYTKASRASKYAILVIGLTFLVYFFVEVMQKMRIHAFQYILVGLSICVFYLLLVSLSEHMRFNLAYWLSAGGTIAAITVYSSAIFRNKKATAIMALCLVFMYGFMFVIIQLQDYALLVGSIALFVILGILMYLSRKIRWFEDEEDLPVKT